MKAEDNKGNLCGTCALEFATCPSFNVLFGEAIGQDNVIECDIYQKKDTADDDIHN